MVNKIEIFVKQNVFFSFSILATFICFSHNYDNGIKVLSYFVSMIKSIGILLILMFCLLGVLTVWMQSSKAKKILASSGGGKGYIYAYSFGVLVCGPIYPGFSFGKTLIEKKVSIATVVIMLNVWATTKISLLPFEIKLLGYNITMIRWIVTLVVVYFSAITCELIINKIKRGD